MLPRLAPRPAGAEAERPVDVVVGAEVIVLVDSAYSAEATRPLLPAALVA